MAYKEPSRKIQFPNENLNRNKINDESESLLAKTSDSNQVRELKNKMTLVMNKLTQTKKQKQNLAKQNKSLQQQLITMQTNLRQMIPGFANTSSSFPIHNELATKIAEFYKYDCLDVFFDLLCSELKMKGILFFYSICFQRLNTIVFNYMNPALNSLIKIGCFTTLQGPIMNVLRKSFQSNYQKILKQVFTVTNLKIIVNQIQSNLNLGDRSEEVQEQVFTFVNKLSQLVLFCYISDPPLCFDIASIGKKISFNPLKHDPFDGFIKPKEECWVVLPEVRKGVEGIQQISKALVLQTTYDILN